MSGTTDTVSKDCEKRAVFAIDVLATSNDLFLEPIPLDTRLGDLGLGDGDCAKLTIWVNMRRTADGREPIDDPITPATTIAEVIAHVC